MLHKILNIYSYLLKYILKEDSLRLEELGKARNLGCVLDVLQTPAKKKALSQS